MQRPNQALRTPLSHRALTHAPQPATHRCPCACSEKYGLAYVISKMGLLFVYDVQNLTAVYRQRISADPVFLACASPSTGGVYVITRRGSVLSVTVNHDTMVPFISTSLKNMDLAIRLATRASLPGAEPLFQQKFDQVRAVSLIVLRCGGSCAAVVAGYEPALRFVIAEPVDACAFRHVGGHKLTVCLCVDMS